MIKNDSELTNSNLVINGIRFIQEFFTKGNSRTLAIKKNVVSSIFMRGISMILGFIQIPITIHYLGATNYGIWVTIGSVIMLINFFDIGLEKGLKNNFAQSRAEKNDSLARSYVSTTYFLIGIIMMAVYLIFLALLPFVNWGQILNAPPELSKTVTLVVFIVFTSFVVNFVLQIVRTVFVADQKPAFLDFTRLCGSILTLSAIIIVANYSEKSLILVALSFSIVPIIIYIVSSSISYSTFYKAFRPSFKSIDLKLSKSLLNLGVKFLIIKISVFILYSSDNMIIAQILGPSEVTPYSITFKYFSGILAIFTIIAAPFWVAFTDAHHKKEIKWIKSSMTKLKKISLSFCVIIIFMIVVSDKVYELWIGKEIEIPFTLSLFMGINVAVMILATPFIQYINGVGKITLQLYIAVFNSIFNIFLSVVLAKYLGFGLTGVIIATCIANVIALCVWPIQYRKIISNKAVGIWSK